MAKKITITLSDKAEQYFAELMYSFTVENDKPCTQSDAINESLETLSDFENLTDNQLRNWNGDFESLSGDNNEQLRKFAANPLIENIPKDNSIERKVIIRQTINNILSDFEEGRHSIKDSAELILNLLK